MSSSSPLLHPRHDGSSSSATPTPLSDIQLKYVAAIGILWDGGIVIALWVILVNSFDEKPTLPLRIWLYGYGFERLTSVVVVLFKYWSRTITPRDKDSETGGVDLEDRNENSTLYRFGAKFSEIHNVITTTWWILGLLLVIIGGFTHFAEAPKLYWSTVFLVAMVVVLPIVLAFVSVFVELSGIFRQNPR